MKDMRPVMKIRFGKSGMEKWNNFICEWEILNYQYQNMNRKQLGRHFSCYQIEWV